MMARLMELILLGKPLAGVPADLQFGLTDLVIYTRSDTGVTMQVGFGAWSATFPVGNLIGCAGGYCNLCSAAQIDACNGSGVQLQRAGGAATTTVLGVQLNTFVKLAVAVLIVYVLFVHKWE